MDKTAKQRLDTRLQELNHIAKKALGQNFLVSDHVINKIIEAVQMVKPNRMIEIGPGLGAITDLLLELNVPYRCIEMDNKLVEYWQNQNLDVISGDALRINWSEIDADLLVSNLPYQISSSIVIDRSVQPYQIQNMVLMFQKEVAQRIRAKHDSDAYGMLSVIAQEFWNIQTVCDAGPRDFFPPPKIASRVLHFQAKDSEIKDRHKYLKFVKLCFSQRRRILTSNLSGYSAENLSEKLALWYQAQKVSDKVRGEQLSPAQFKNLFFYLHQS